MKTLPITPARYRRMLLLERLFDGEVSKSECDRLVSEIADLNETVDEEYQELIERAS